MSYSFNPVKEGDWQALNILLEKLSVGTAEAGNKVKKTGSVSARKTKAVIQEATSSIETGQPSVDSVPVLGYEGDMGIEIYGHCDAEENVTLPEESIIYKTQAKITVPSMYYRDLRGVRLTTATQKYTADYLVLYNSSDETVGLANVDETNNVGTAGPIAGGRDQAGAFTAETFVHFFIIYNPTSKDVSSLSSASATAPTLPSGYTFYRRVGSVYFDALSHLRVCNQIDNEIFVDWAAGLVFSSKAPAFANTWESVDISAKIPATAKTVRGIVGANTGTGSKTMGVGVDDDEFMVSFFVFTAPSYGFTWNFPVLTAQTLWWKASTNDAHYCLIVTSYLDDL